MGSVGRWRGLRRLALAVYEGDLIAAGNFTTAGGVTVNRIARWNGETWSALGSGLNDAVGALAVYNGELIAGGRFTTAGGVKANQIARWDGYQWQPLGGGVTGRHRTPTSAPCLSTKTLWSSAASSPPCRRDACPEHRPLGWREMGGHRRRGRRLGPRPDRCRTAN